MISKITKKDIPRRMEVRNRLKDQFVTFIRASIGNTSIYEVV